jgi:hypothetical protein
VTKYSGSSDASAGTRRREVTRARKDRVWSVKKVQQWSKVWRGLRRFVPKGKPSTGGWRGKLQDAVHTTASPALCSSHRTADVSGSKLQERGHRRSPTSDSQRRPQGPRLNEPLFPRTITMEGTAPAEDSPSGKTCTIDVTTCLCDRPKTLFPESLPSPKAALYCSSAISCLKDGFLGRMTRRRMIPNQKTRPGSQSNNLTRRPRSRRRPRLSGVGC